MRKRIWFNRAVQGMVIVAAAVLLGLGAAWYQDDHLAETLSGKVLRFHVIANSDSEEDQALKLAVRDAVGAYMQELLRDVSSLEESRAVTESHLQEICEVAEAVIAEEGYDYPVTAALERAQFPDKTYGRYTLPGGSYQALRVVIGGGEGQNWWCVMYPNMCFANSVYVAGQDADEKLYQILTVNEYRRLIESGDRQYRLRLFSGSREK